MVKGEFLPMQHTVPFGDLTDIVPGRKGYAVQGGIVLEPEDERGIL